MNKYFPQIFSYSGKKFQLYINIFNEYNNQSIDNTCLDGNDILSFEWTGKMNDLVLTGKIHYVDKYGKCDRYVNQQYTICEVDFTEIEYKFDADITIEKTKKGQQFKHVFIVNNVKILNREREQIEYEFSLVSFNWIKLSANIYFSNFNKQKESIFEIIKQCLVKNDLQFDQESFDKIKTDVKINYITNTNDDIFTIVKYLLNRLYYYQVRDDSIKMLNYNSVNDTYYLYDVSKVNKGFGNKSVIVQFFNSSTETQLQTQYSNFATITKMPKTEMYKKQFMNNIYDYSYDYDTIKENTISSCNIIDYLNSKIENDKDNNIFKKFNTFKFKSLQYKTENTYWNNDLQIYNDSISMMLQNNSLVINTIGEISVKPGTLVTITIDKTLLQSQAGENQNQEKLQESADKFAAFEGTWIAIKVQHIIEPNTPEYTQNITLFRPHITLKENLKSL